MKIAVKDTYQAGTIGLCVVLCTNELMIMNRSLAEKLGMNQGVKVWGGNMKAYASDNPVKFAALGTFILLGAIPFLTFTTYCVATLVICTIGALAVEIFLLALGITGLTFVLFFVTCASVCVTSLFGALLFAYHVASSAMSKAKGMGFLRGPTAQDLGGSPDNTNKTK